MGTMTTSANDPIAAEISADNLGALLEPEQLSLLPQLTGNARFRLDIDTRRRGLRHIAEIRRQMAARAQANRAASQAADRAHNRPAA